MAPIHVSADNFVRAETHRMFRDLGGLSGAMSTWFHIRQPASVDAQTVIRMNRDTLYSAAVVDLSEPVSVTLPEPGDRYQTVMVVNEDHHINEVFAGAGTHTIDPAVHGTRHVLLAARTLVDTTDPDDVAEAHRLQDGLGLQGGAATPFEMPDYDTVSLDAARAALLELARLSDGFEGAFGSVDEVDPIRHLIGTAAGWGGLPDREARYESVSPGLPVGHYRIEVGEVPVDAFWSISVYNAEGYFEPNDQGAYSINSVTAARNADGTITVDLVPGASDAPNAIPITEGWNYVVRLYRPRPEILDGTWSFPSARAV